MPPRSKVYELDAETRQELNRRIVESGFGRYAGHSAWLAERGHSISASALSRYGVQLKREADSQCIRTAVAESEAVARIRAVTDIVGDVDGNASSVTERMMQLAQAGLIRVMLDQSVDAKTLVTIYKSMVGKGGGAAPPEGDNSEPPAPEVIGAMRAIIEGDVVINDDGIPVAYSEPGKTRG